MARAYRLTPTRKLVNRLVRALLRLGVPFPRTYLLTVLGRRSGRSYSTPVTLVERSGSRWLVAPYGTVAWVRNARAAGEVTLSRSRRSETVRVEEAGPEEAASVLQQYLREVPVVRPYFDVAPDSPLEELAAEAPRHPVFLLLA